MLAYTIAAELGDIERFAVPRKLAGYSGLCPRVYQSGERDLRGPLAKQGPKYLRWALVEAATHACTAPVYRDRVDDGRTVMPPRFVPTIQGHGGHPRRGPRRTEGRRGTLPP